jgi:hypothetical protein
VTGDLGDLRRDSPLADPRRYYLAYLTANDQRSFLLDYLHFRNMAVRDPGVPAVDVVIAISRVRPFSAADRRDLEYLVRHAAESPWLRIHAVIWKGNVGRDFGSADACLKWIARAARPDDYVMVRNRSAYGPTSGDWYRAYVSQYRRHAGTGLVGSTINLIGHPKISRDGLSPHVQSYVYLSEWRRFAALLADDRGYPGSRCTERLDLIEQGEIGLSKRVMESGLRISSLYWPEYAWGSGDAIEPSLPRADIKSEAREVPLSHRLRGYTLSPSALKMRTEWALRHVRGHAASGPGVAAGIEELRSSDYD